MDILYHYCSNDSFCSIIKNHEIWLSSLSLSNDSMEGKLISRLIFERAAADKCNLDLFEKLLISSEEAIDGLGFCLSQEGDLLSQWRGYAWDATGVSIGFSKDYLEKLASLSINSGKSGFKLHQVIYDHSSQISLIEPAYLEMKKHIEEGLFKIKGTPTILGGPFNQEEIEKEKKRRDDISIKTLITMLPLYLQLFLLKTKAFQEEREWRLISHFVRPTDECLFRSLKDRIVPYRKFDLSKLDSNSVIEVILGPKNLTPNNVVERLLSLNGFTDVKVKRSEASYR